jgi:hypothetical protein
MTVGAAEGCDLLILFFKIKDRSLRQLLQGALRRKKTYTKNLTCTTSNL